MTGQLGIGIDIEFADAEFSFDLVGQLIHHRIDAAADTAPRRPAVQQDGQRRSQDEVLEIGVAHQHRPTGQDIAMGQQRTTATTLGAFMEFVHRDPVLGPALTAAQRDLRALCPLLGRWSHQRLVAPATLGILWRFVGGNTVFSATVAAGDNRRTHAGTPFFRFLQNPGTRAPGL